MGWSVRVSNPDRDKRFLSETPRAALCPPPRPLLQFKWHRDSFRPVKRPGVKLATHLRQCRGQK
jgi:hypothetical protein